MKCHYIVKVRNEDESKIVQTILFAIGYEWVSTGTKFNYLEYPGIGVWDDKKLTYCDHIDMTGESLTLGEFLDMLEKDKNEY